MGDAADDALEYELRHSLGGFGNFGKRPRKPKPHEFFDQAKRKNLTFDQLQDLVNAGKVQAKVTKTNRGNDIKILWIDDLAEEGGEDELILEMSQFDIDRTHPELQKWQTADGRKMKIADMKNDHLNNAILHMEKAVAKAAEYSLTDGMHYRFRMILANLNGERERRGLPIALLPIASLEYRRLQYQSKDAIIKILQKSFGN